MRTFTYSYACFLHCCDKLTTEHGLHAACSVLVCQVSTVVICACVYSGHIAATKFAYSCSLGFLGKRTTWVTALVQTLPFLWRGWPTRLRYFLTLGHLYNTGFGNFWSLVDWISFRNFWSLAVYAGLIGKFLILELCRIWKLLILW